MPSLSVVDPLVNHEQPPGARRSERPKKPSSRWNEEDGYLAQPLRLAKKKSSRGDPAEDPEERDKVKGFYCNRLAQFGVTGHPF